MPLLDEHRAKIESGIAGYEQEIAWAKEDAAAKAALAAQATAEADAAKAEALRRAADDLADDNRIAFLEAEVARLKAELPDGGPADPSGLTDRQKRFGVQCFADRGNYLDLAGSKRMIDYLQVKIIRSGVTVNMPQGQIDFYNALYDEQGVMSHMTVGKPREVLTAEQWDRLAATLAKLRGVKVLYGWNEPAHNRDGAGLPLTDWQVKTIRHQAELMRRFNAEYVIGSAQMWSGNKETHDAELRSLAAANAGTTAAPVRYKGKFEWNVWHLYQSGEARMREYEALYTELFGVLPIQCSETGMSTAPAQTSGAKSMTEAGQATYLVQHLNMYDAAGHDAVWFELRDDPNPLGDDREKWLGVFRADGTPKPAATAYRDWLQAA